MLGKLIVCFSSPMPPARGTRKPAPRPLLTPLSTPCCLRHSSTHAFPSSCIHSLTPPPTAAPTHDGFSPKLERNASASISACAPAPAPLASPISPVPPQAYLEYLARYSPITAASPLHEQHDHDHASFSPASARPATSTAAASILPYPVQTRHAIDPNGGAASTFSVDHDAAFSVRSAGADPQMHMSESHGATVCTTAARRCGPLPPPLPVGTCRAVPLGSAGGGGGSRSAPLPAISAMTANEACAAGAGVAVGVDGGGTGCRAGRGPAEERQEAQDLGQGWSVAVPLRLQAAADGAADMAVTTRVMGKGRLIVVEVPKGKR